ncbi:hypothetical protein [Levilactobacillus brevis]|uniref:hypothetical protein n=1 Tax=Levilactobacillus brevis TaxID=1580 RepID=UPI0020735A9E|nr:hypothetical protein [Levilactobacillus brevis]
MNFEFVWEGTKSWRNRIRDLISNEKLSKTDQAVLYELGLLALHPKRSTIIEDKLNISKENFYLSLAHLEKANIIRYQLDNEPISTPLVQ